MPKFDSLVALIVDESKWLAVSMVAAFIGVAQVFWRCRRSGIPWRQRLQGALNVCFALTVVGMAFGHLLAVTTKLLRGTLEGSIPLFYGIGILLIVPAVWLLVHSQRRVVGKGFGRGSIQRNVWLMISLLVLGPHNWPLAAPGLLNIAYQLHSRVALGWAIVGVALTLHGALFLGSLVFLASGQSFEQFSSDA